MPVAGSLTRSSLNAQSEREPGFSNLLAEALVLKGLLGDWVDLVPLPSLATLVIYRLITRQGKANQRISQATRSDGIVFKLLPLASDF